MIIVSVVVVMVVVSINQIRCFSYKNGIFLHEKCSKCNDLVFFVSKMNIGSVPLGTTTSSRK